jgi:hypothetical protein
LLLLLRVHFSAEPASGWLVQHKPSVRISTRQWALARVLCGHNLRCHIIDRSAIRPSSSEPTASPPEGRASPLADDHNSNCCTPGLKLKLPRFHVIGACDSCSCFILVSSTHPRCVFRPLPDQVGRSGVRDQTWMALYFCKFVLVPCPWNIEHPQMTFESPGTELAISV